MSSALTAEVITSMPTINIQLTKMLILQCMASTLRIKTCRSPVGQSSANCPYSHVSKKGTNCSLQGLLVEAVLNCTYLRHAAC